MRVVRLFSDDASSCVLQGMVLRRFPVASAAFLRRGPYLVDSTAAACPHRVSPADTIDPRAEIVQCHGRSYTEVVVREIARLIQLATVAWVT